MKIGFVFPVFMRFIHFSSNFASSSRLIKKEAFKSIVSPVGSFAFAASAASSSGENTSVLTSFAGK